MTRIPPIGLSPRVRGNHDAQHQSVHGSRSIPACAGEPGGMMQIRRPGRVYPRVCGGTILLAGVAANTSGLSPRVRGNHFPAGAVPRGAGSIPACAGEPSD